VVSGARVDAGGGATSTWSEQSGPPQPSSQWHLFRFVQNCKQRLPVGRGRVASGTHPVTGALQVVVVRRTLRLVDVRKDAGTSLVKANEVLSARGSVPDEAAGALGFSVVAGRRRSVNRPGHDSFRLSLSKYSLALVLRPLDGDESSREGWLVRARPQNGLSLAFLTVQGAALDVFRRALDERAAPHAAAVAVVQLKN
jgi:hypothetical protein